MKQRCNYLDFLRFIGISAIILAHVNPHFIISQLRSFDVPLMLFVSGLAFSGKQITNHLSFVIKRTKRLIVPIYVFFSIYFVVLLVLKRIDIVQVNLPITQIICTFLLLNTKSIGYVWIIRVFILITIMTPFLLKFNKRLTNTSCWFVLVLLIIFLELSVFIMGKILPYKFLYYPYYEIVPFSIAYLIPFVLGLKIRYNSRQFEISSIFILFTLLIICTSLESMFSGPIEELSPKYKFPPRHIFVIYGSLISCILWYSRRWFNFIADNRLVLFIGQNTIWIYLWHIPYVAIFNSCVSNFFLKFVLVYICASCTFMLQYRIVHKLYTKHQYPLFKYLVG